MTQNLTRKFRAPHHYKYIYIYIVSCFFNDVPGISESLARLSMASPMITSYTLRTSHVPWPHSHSALHWPFCNVAFLGLLCTTLVVVIKSSPEQRKMKQHEWKSKSNGSKWANDHRGVVSKFRKSNHLYWQWRSDQVSIPVTTWTRFDQGSRIWKLVRAHTAPLLAGFDLISKLRLDSRVFRFFLGN